MLRLISFIVTVAVVVAVAVWLADRPGSVTIEWLDHRVDTSVPILLLAIVVAVGALWLVFWLLGSITGMPTRLVLRQRALRQHRGYQALAHGLAAAAAGQGKEARKHADRAERLLADPALTAVLSAQAAQLSGDGKETQTRYTALLDRPETAALGLRGLLREALANNETATAIDFATRARRLSPADPWLAETLFGLLVHDGRPKEAEALVDDAQKKGAMTADIANRRRAVLAHVRAKHAHVAGRLRDAIEHARRAVKNDPNFSVGAATLALHHIAADEKRRAVKVLTEAWKRSPGPELMAAAHKLAEKESPLAHLRTLEKITEGAADHPETHKSLGEAALAARLWGEARRHLLAAAKARPTQSIYRLLARLEEAEFGDKAAAHAWIEKAAQASPDPGWACTACGTPAAEWVLECPSCHAIDTLAWIASRPATNEGDTTATQLQ